MCEYELLFLYFGYVFFVLFWFDGFLFVCLLFEEFVDEGCCVVLFYYVYVLFGGVVVEVVFVNFGCEEDYVVFESFGVGVCGCVVVVCCGGGYCGGVVVCVVDKGVVVVFIVGNVDGGVESGVVFFGGFGDLFIFGWVVISGVECLKFDDKVVK